MLDANTKVVLLGAGLLGIAGGAVGALALLRRTSLVTDALAHAALPGVCLAYLVVGERNLIALLIGALFTGLCGVSTITAVRSIRRVKGDAAIGIVLSSYFGLGIVLSRIIQNQPGGNRAGLDSFIMGKAASMVRSDVILLAFVALLVLCIIALLQKELKLIAFDRDYAATQGWPVRFLELLVLAITCVATVAGLPAVGAVLIVALIVTPAATARFWTNNFEKLVVLSGLIGGIAAGSGVLLSSVLPAPLGSLSRGWPTGPLIVIVLGVCFGFSLLFAPERGIVAEWFAHRRRRNRNE